MADVHVVPQASCWGLEVDGDIRSTYDPQGEAIKASGELADAYQREPVVHPAAKIREKHSQRNDPSDLLG
jgi:hypothetical protein